MTKISVLPGVWWVDLPESGLLPEATCKQLLSLEDDRVRLHAVQQLIRRGAATSW